jgi:hypothetical protein
VWLKYDDENHFGSLKTLYRYAHALSRQIDELLRALIEEVITLDSGIALPKILPEENVLQKKLEILFALIPALIDLLHRKNRSTPVLQDEHYDFFHCFIFHHCLQPLLRNTS